jgi:hypothetical protein
MTDSTAAAPRIDFRRCAEHSQVPVDLASCEPCRVHAYASLLGLETPGCADHSGDSQPDCVTCVARAQHRQLQHAFFGLPGPRRLACLAVLLCVLAITAYLLGHEQTAYACGGVSNASLVAWFVYARIAGRRRLAASYRDRVAEAAGSTA